MAAIDATPQRKILHTVYFKFRDSDSSFESQLQEMLETGFNSLPGIKASIAPHGGHSGVGKTELLNLLEWPDKTYGYTHCELLVADDTAALKAYLHSDAHLKVWIPAIKESLESILVFDNPLLLPHPFSVPTPSNAILHTVFFKLPKIDASKTAALARLCNEQFNALPGITATFAVHGDHGGVEKAMLLNELDWADKTQGFTHCELLIADDVTALKAYLHSDAHLKVWIPAIRDDLEDIIVFDSPLKAIHTCEQ